MNCKRIPFSHYTLDGFAEIKMHAATFSALYQNVPHITCPVGNRKHAAIMLRPCFPIPIRGRTAGPAPA